MFVEKPGEDFTALKLISGPYASIVYKYGNVGFADESKKTPEGALPMQFDYTVIENNILADTDSQDLLDEQMKQGKQSESEKMQLELEPIEE